jgi:amino acid transporter
MNKIVKFWRKLSKSLRKEIITWAIFLLNVLVLVFILLSLFNIGNILDAGILGFFVGLLMMVLTRLFVEKYIKIK